MELGAAGHRSGRGRLMANVTHVCSIDHVAKMLGEDPKLLEAIVYSDDNLNYGSIISVYTGPDDTVTALTDDGIDELNGKFGGARSTFKTWDDRGDDFVDDPELVARIKAQSPRKQPTGYRRSADASPRTDASLASPSRSRSPASPRRPNAGGAQHPQLCPGSQLPT